MGAYVYRTMNNVTNMTKVGIKLGTMMAGAALLSGCVLFDDSRRVGPDEFGVVSRAPLSQPPDFALRPPRAGDKRPNEVSPRDEARSRLITTANRDQQPIRTAPRTPVAASAPENGLSAGERAMLQKAGAVNIDPDIRLIVDRESGRVKEDESLVDTLVFWRKSDKEAKVVDPKRESMRLSKNAALGAPPKTDNAQPKPQ